MANELKADAMLVFTFGGHMARHAAWMRPRYSPIYVACEDARVARALTLNWGVIPKIVAFDRIQPENTIHEALKLLQAEGVLKIGNTVVVVGVVSTGTQIIDAVQMRRID